MSVPRSAVVTIAHGRHDHLRAQQRGLSDAGLRPEHYVVVAMGDEILHRWRPAVGVRPEVVPCTVPAAGLPLAAARNAGAEVALASGVEVLIFLDVDCLPGDGLVAAYVEAATARPDVVWSGPVTYLPPPPTTGYDLDRLPEMDSPHPARPAPAPGEWLFGGDPDLFWSLSFALHRDAWARIGGFCEDYVGYGAEDTDFAREAVRSGLQHGWCGSARAYHQHHATQSPPKQHLDAILRNGRVFRDRWGTWPMLGWLEQFEREGLVHRHGEDWLPSTAATASDSKIGSPGELYEGTA